MNNYLVDSHTHLVNKYFSNIDDCIDRALENDVKYIINSSFDINSMKEILELTKKYNYMVATLGIHPDQADIYKDEDIEFIVNNIKDDKVVAIGEIGLDYYYTKENKVKQIELFEKQLMIAEEYNLPVVIHSREATKDTMDILKKYKVKGVIHSFSGSYETALEYIKMGFLLGVNGVVTFKNCNTKEWLYKIDLSNIVLETDAPYLTPVPNRGKRNEPLHIKDIAYFLSDLYNTTYEDIKRITSDNVFNLYSKMKR